MLTLAQKQILFESLGYAPHAGQVQAHASEARVLQVVGAERSGKSKFTGMEGLCDLLPVNDPRAVRVAVCAQTYDESHKEMEYIAEGLDVLGILRGYAHPKQGKWIIETAAGGWVETVSFKDGANELTGTGEPYDLVAIVEAGRVAQEGFTAARMRVAERRGRVILSGTLWSDHGWYNDLYEELKGANRYGGECFSFPMWLNLAIFPEGRQDPEILKLERSLEESEFLRRVCAQGVPSPARIYPEFAHAVHVQELAFDPDEDVYLSVDPGYFPSRYAVLALQTGTDDLGRDVVYVVDEVWEHHLLHEEIIAVCRDRPWWNKVIGVYGGHETRAHALAGPSTRDVWVEKTRLPFTIVRRPSNKKLTYMRVKSFLKDADTLGPRLYVDVECPGLIYEFAHYERRTDTWGVVTSDDPAANSADDALDALANFLVERYGLVDRAALVVPARRHAPAWVPSLG